MPGGFIPPGQIKYQGDPEMPKHFGELGRIEGELKQKLLELRG
nr:MULTISPECIES: hypothetical protein [unclassified Pseudoflavonifractor]